MGKKASFCGQKSTKTRFSTGVTGHADDSSGVDNGRGGQPGKGGWDGPNNRRGREEVERSPPPKRPQKMKIVDKRQRKAWGGGTFPDLCRGSGKRQGNEEGGEPPFQRSKIY